MTLAPIPLTEPQLRAEQVRAVDVAGGQGAWAVRHGVERTVVSRAISGTRDVPESVANALGYVRQVRFVQVRKSAQMPVVAGVRDGFGLEENHRPENGAARDEAVGPARPGPDHRMFEARDD